MYCHPKLCLQFAAFQPSAATLRLPLIYKGDSLLLLLFSVFSVHQYKSVVQIMTIISIISSDCMTVFAVAFAVASASNS